MPPNQEESKPVDLSNQYGAKGPNTGVFQYVHHEPEEKGFDLSAMIIAAGIVQTPKDAQRFLGAIAGICFLAVGIFYWLLYHDVAPPQLNRPAVDSGARIIH